ncbi:hypothetical protein C4572_02565 [Candidatus Parcubacteria bacterium]|nr:MAG: hypothetical protein C4572_02565 [Candidatus Parcubacteria bacterium]
MTQYTIYRDADLDGYGAGASQISCSLPGPGYSSSNTDCDDTDDAVYPGATEDCFDGIDNNCDDIFDMNDPSCTYCGDGTVQRPNSSGVNEVCDYPVSSCSADCTAINWTLLSLKSYWGFNSGNANDSWGPTYDNGILEGDASIVTGGRNSAYALSLDGLGDDMALPLQYVTDLLAPQFTLNLWVRPSIALDRPTFGFKDSSQWNYANPFSSYDSGLNFANGSNYQRLQPGLTESSSSSWTMYTIVDDGTYYRFYLNGTEVIDHTFEDGYPDLIEYNPSHANTRQFVFGQSGFSNLLAQWYNGRYDEIRLFNRGLTAQEIRMLYQSY